MTGRRGEEPLDIWKNRLREEMCAGCEDRVQENRPSLSLRSLNVITRGYVEALRVWSIKLTQKDFAAQPRARSVAPIPMATASQLDSRQSFRMSYYSLITALSLSNPFFFFLSFFFQSLTLDFVKP